MRIREIVEILSAEVITGKDKLDVEIPVACGSDLMSDVLAYVDGHGAMLLTGLINQQVVRTADMLDMRCITFVRGKKPEQEIIDLAERRDIALLSTNLRLYTACGKLYKAGLEGGCDI